ncbi:DUF4249 domain-containing protein [Mariniflexile maritimum]|uniref:DUF4249 domain-containing protein n=1 Tax=Mariniflexile maritimum TaxID=2682493 RepID=UPI0012F6F101|nr:DUF4249 domain-containing protein [Mariniflexile maritimum]HMR15022.1 DUF4249 domain-containing protein [Mariniflexile sp.]
MKLFIKSTVILLTGFLLFACEDIIEVEVPTGKKRLVIEASLDWEKGTTGSNQTIKLRTSTPYFNIDTNTNVTGASVKVSNTRTNDIFIFSDQNNGSYTTTSFVPVIGDTYQLEVIYNNETYTAVETLTAVPAIKSISQSTKGGLDDELLEVNIYFDDPPTEGNNYMTRYHETGDLFPYFYTFPDEFTNGNEMLDFYEKLDNPDNNQTPFQTGDIVYINLYGISEQYYNFMNLLINQYYNGGNPFSVVAAEIKGNCINVTTPENYAFGYFRVTEVVKTNYTFQ